MKTKIEKIRVQVLNDENKVIGAVEVSFEGIKYLKETYDIDAVKLVTEQLFHEIEKMVTEWGEMDILLIEKVRNKIAPLIAMNFPDAITRIKIKNLMEEALPDYEIKCDEENNSPEIVDSGNVRVRVKTKTQPDGLYNYIDVIF